MFIRTVKNNLINTKYIIEIEPMTVNDHIDIIAKSLRPYNGKTIIEFDILSTKLNLDNIDEKLNFYETFLNKE